MQSWKIIPIAIFSFLHVQGFGQLPDTANWPKTRTYKNDDLVDWPTTKNRKLYAASGKSIVHLSMDSLRLVPFRSPDQADVLRYVEGTVPLTPGEYVPIYMGYEIGSFEDKNSVFHKIVLSHYAGFFDDTYNNIYYQVPKDKYHEWQGFLFNQYKIE